MKIYAQNRLQGQHEDEVLQAGADWISYLTRKPRVETGSDFVAGSMTYKGEDVLSLTVEKQGSKYKALVLFTPWQGTEKQFSTELKPSDAEDASRALFRFWVSCRKQYDATLKANVKRLREEIKDIEKEIDYLQDLNKSLPKV